MTINIWGTRLDPATGLPVYPVSGMAQGAANRLKDRAKKARATREALQTRLDRLTDDFESAFAESDRRTDTQKRIAAAATNTRPTH